MAVLLESESREGPNLYDTPSRNDADDILHAENDSLRLLLAADCCKMFGAPGSLVVLTRPKVTTDPNICARTTTEKKVSQNSQPRPVHVHVHVHVHVGGTVGTKRDAFAPGWAQGFG